MIRRADTADLSRLTRTGMRAFANDPLMRWIVPNDDAYASGLGELLQRIMFVTWLGVGEIWSTDDGVALAAWSPPEPIISEELGIELGAIRDRFPDDMKERLARLRPVLREHRPQEPHWYLNILATHPDWQRQGLGMAVMQPIRQRCDADQLGQYLETATEEDIAYYSSRGFTITSRWTLDGTVAMAGMWRAPGAGNR